MNAVMHCLANDRFAAHCNVRLLSVQPGQARASLLVRPEHLNGLGMVQGGAIFTLADFAFAAASNSHGTSAVAVNVSITFMQPTTTGVLYAEAKEISRTSRLASYTVEVRNEAEGLVALFQGLAYRKKDKLADSSSM